MRLHHLNCGTMNVSFGKMKMQIVLHCLLIDSGNGLILVDTGYGLRDYEKPTRMVNWMMNTTGSPRNAEEAMIRQVVELGYDPGDVRHIVMTHMHIDHTGGLPDFPQAKVHLYQAEYDAIMKPRGLTETFFYVQDHWAHQPEWVTYGLEGDQWFGFEATRPLDIEGVEMRLIPMVGHSRGLCGVAVKLGEARWMLHCGDVYAGHDLVDLNKPMSVPTGLVGAVMRRSSIVSAIFTHVPRLRELKARMGDDLILICSHDRSEFEQWRGVVHERAAITPD